ncbi:MAG TPA: hypothetical protein VLL52_06695 [Anaerolineae bacterium]|nr:hypothetical protein [Anaerolineae bacterium]
MGGSETQDSCSSGSVVIMGVMADRVIGKGAVLWVRIVGGNVIMGGLTLKLMVCKRKRLINMRLIPSSVICLGRNCSQIWRIGLTDLGIVCSLLKNLLKPVYIYGVFRSLMSVKSGNVLFLTVVKVYICFG